MEQLLLNDRYAGRMSSMGYMASYEKVTADANDISLFAMVDHRLRRIHNRTKANLFVARFHRLFGFEETS